MPVEPKAVVRRFNIEVIQQGNEAAFHALMAPDFVNHAAPAGAPNGPESMWNTFQNILRPALSGLTVTIHDQIAEGDKVTTRKPSLVCIRAHYWAFLRQDERFPSPSSTLCGSTRDDMLNIGG